MENSALYKFAYAMDSTTIPGYLSPQEHADYRDQQAYANRRAIVDPIVESVANSSRRGLRVAKGLAYTGLGVGALATGATLYGGYKAAKGLGNLARKALY